MTEITPLSARSVTIHRPGPILVTPGCREVPSATASLPPKADLAADFDRFAPESGRQLSVACRGKVDPEQP
jgi:hypothetical protein